MRFFFDIGAIGSSARRTDAPERRWALTLEDARTWIEETGLCLFLPKRQFSSALAPSFVEAIAGQRNSTPDSKQIAQAEELLVRLENDGVAVRLNLLGQPGEQPDYVVAGWVLPYVYALGATATGGGFPS